MEERVLSADSRPNLTIRHFERLDYNSARRYEIARDEPMSPGQPVSRMSLKLALQRRPKQDIFSTSAGSNSKIFRRSRFLKLEAKNCVLQCNDGIFIYRFPCLSKITLFNAYVVVLSSLFNGSWRESSCTFATTAVRFRMCLRLTIPNSSVGCIREV